MVTNEKNADNPYSPPRESAIPIDRFRIARWLSLGIAIILVLFSLPIAWHTLELANQEYLHIWNSRRVIYDIEINGVPVSIGTAILEGVKIVLIQWSIAGVLIITPRIFAEITRRNNA